VRGGRYSTIDQADIRGSTEAAFTVFIRRELPLTGLADLAAQRTPGFSIVAGSPADSLNSFVLRLCWLLVRGDDARRGSSRRCLGLRRRGVGQGRLRRRAERACRDRRRATWHCSIRRRDCCLPAMLAFGFEPYGPDKASKLAGHGSDHFCTRLALVRQCPVATVQPSLRGLSHTSDLRWQRRQQLLAALVRAGPVSVVPSGLHERSSTVACLADGALPLLATRGVLRRHQARVAHHLPRSLKPLECPKLHCQRRRGLARYTAQGRRWPSSARRR